MTLQEIVRQLDQFERGMTIYAAIPWHPLTHALVARPRDDGRATEEAVATGCAYFLEVFMAQGALHDLPGLRGREPSDSEGCARLIEYAEWLRSDATGYPFMKWNFPVTMMIYCNGCGKHFDIVVTGKDSADHCCPACEGACFWSGGFLQEGDRAEQENAEENAWTPIGIMVVPNQNHRTERRLATSVANANALRRPHRSVLALVASSHHE